MGGKTIMIKNMSIFFCQRKDAFYMNKKKIKHFVTFFFKVSI